MEELEQKTSFELFEQFLFYYLYVIHKFFYIFFYKFSGKPFSA